MFYVDRHHISDGPMRNSYEQEHHHLILNALRESYCAISILLRWLLKLFLIYQILRVSKQRRILRLMEYQNTQLLGSRSLKCQIIGPARLSPGQISMPTPQ